MTLAEQVAAQVAKVRAASGRAISELEGGWYTTDAEHYAASAIRGLRGNIDDWAKAGADAATKNAAPPNGWAGWTAHGQALLQGIEKDIPAGASHETLDAIKATVAAIPKNIPADLKAGAKAVTTTAGSVVAGAGEGLASTLPLGRILLGLGLVLGVAGLVLFGAARAKARLGV